MDDLFYSGAVGMVETKGGLGAAAAADAMLKAASVHLAGRERNGTLVTVIIRGRADCVRKAVQKGAACAEDLGSLVSFCVIAEPHGQLTELLPGEL